MIKFSNKIIHLTFSNYKQITKNLANNNNPKTEAELRNRELKVTDGKDKDGKKSKSKSREFIDALIYAGVVAFIIKILLFEAFRIPTGSMEKTL
ncbi:MAG: hypothetical protein IPI04_08975 [Ignavibacteria bacterium]|nr:hypothetical protein [Ignavibacteria bacterium]